MMMISNTESLMDRGTLTKKELPCVVCGTSIKPTFPENIDIDNVNILSYDIGAAAKISYGYGCNLDGSVYMIAICESCTREKQAEGKLTYVYNYIP